MVTRTKNLIKNEPKTMLISQHNSCVDMMTLLTIIFFIYTTISKAFFRKENQRFISTHGE